MAATVNRLHEEGMLVGDRLSGQGRNVRAEIERRTDAMEEEIVAALMGHLGVLIEQLDRWSAACIEAGSFPPDPLKRAAG